jgi:hypothetical protein
MKRAIMGYDWTTDLVPPDGTVNHHLGVRFDSSGRFLPEAGNTFVAQVTPGTATEKALIWLRDELKSLSQASRFAFTEIASYHMTVFEGVIATRREPRYWPAEVSLQATITEATAAMADILRDFAPPPPFAIRPVEVTPFGLVLTGATSQDEATVRNWRDQLAQLLGLRAPDHDTYRFHTTLAYARSWLPIAALTEYEDAMHRLSCDFVARVPVMELERPAFCQFADMNGFPPVIRL